MATCSLNASQSLTILFLQLGFYLDLSQSEVELLINQSTTYIEIEIFQKLRVVANVTKCIQVVKVYQRLHNKVVKLCISDYAALQNIVTWVTICYWMAVRCSNRWHNSNQHHLQEMFISN